MKPQTLLSRYMVTKLVSIDADGVPLLTLIKRLQAIAERLPKQYVAKAVFEVPPLDCESSCRIKYMRQETKTEWKERLAGYFAGEEAQTERQRKVIEELRRTRAKCP